MKDQSRKKSFKTLTIPLKMKRLKNRVFVKVSLCLKNILILYSENKTVLVLFQQL